MKKYSLVIVGVLSGFACAQMVNVQRPEDHRTHEQYEADCAAGISLSSCGPIPLARDCDPGTHWSLIGKNYQHCVVDDMNCPVGSKLVHDAVGNASCEAIVCPDGTHLVNGECTIFGKLPIPPAELLSTPTYDKQPYSYQYNFGAGMSPQGGWLALNYSSVDGTWYMDVPYPEYPSRSTWFQKGPLKGTWTTTPRTSYSYTVTNVYGGPLPLIDGLPGPRIIPPDSHALMWKCYGGFVNKPGGVASYMPVIIKVWPTAAPNQSVSARFNCEASGSSMRPFTIDARGYPAGTRNEQNLP